MPKIRPSGKPVLLPLLLGFLFLSGCGGGDGEQQTDTGGGQTAPVDGQTPPTTFVEACSDVKLFGDWEGSVTVEGVTQKEVFTITPEDSAVGDLTISGNSFVLKQDGITFTGTVSEDCQQMSGTAVEDATGIAGSWSAVKL